MTAGRALLILTLMSVMVCAQAASLASGPVHVHSSQHCCGLCHSGPLPFLQPAVTSAAFAPMLAVTWLERKAVPGAPRLPLLASCSSRAPPA